MSTSTQWVKDTLNSILELLPDSGLVLELEITDTVHRLGQLHEQLKEYSQRWVEREDPHVLEIEGQSSSTGARVNVHTPPTSHASAVMSTPAVPVPQDPLTTAMQHVIANVEQIKDTRYGSIDQMYQALTQWLDHAQPGHAGVRKINSTGSRAAYFECACADTTGCDFSVRFRKHKAPGQGDSPVVSWKVAAEYRAGGQPMHPMIWQHSVQCMQTCKTNPRQVSQKSIEKSPVLLDLVRHNPNVNAVTVSHVLSVRIHSCLVFICVQLYCAHAKPTCLPPACL